MALIASLVLMVMDFRFHQLQYLRDSLTVVLHPLYLIADFPKTASHWLSDTASTREQLQDSNASLKEENLRLLARLQKFDSLQAENMRLRNLLDASLKVDDRILIAEIISVDLDPYRHQVMINKGSASGVFVGQAVLDADAVMGQVIQVTPLSSTVLLISDATHSVPVEIVRTGERSIAIGTGKIGTLDLPHLPSQTDIEVGDTLVTSGLGGKFPAGYPVASISSINRDTNSGFAQISATPTAYLERSRQVLLVWRNDQNSVNQ